MWKAVLLAMPLVLASCGGGGPDAGTSPFGTFPDPTPRPTGTPMPTPVPSSAVPEGFWVGKAGSYDFLALTLETGETWGVYSSSGVVQGVAHGRVGGSATAFSGPGFDYNLPLHARTAITLSGTYAAKTSLIGSIALPSSSIVFNGTYDASYDTPATLAAAAGTWHVRAVTSTGTVTTTVTVAADGSFAGSNAFCNANGRVTPRASGKNVFDLTVAFSGSNCQFNGSPLAGATVVSGTGASRQFIAAALLPDQNDGFFGIGTTP